MRFRRHQEAAQAGTRRLLGLFALVVAQPVIGIAAITIRRRHGVLVAFGDWWLQALDQS